jgi:hypothetical protein
MEMYALAIDIDRLPIELLQEVVNILAQDVPDFMSRGIHIPMKDVKVPTLRRLEEYVRNALPKIANVKKMKQDRLAPVAPDDFIAAREAEKKRLRERLPAARGRDGEGPTSEATSVGSSESSTSASGSESSDADD